MSLLTRHTSTSEYTNPHTDTLWDPDFAKAHKRLIRLSNHVFEINGQFDEAVMKASQLGHIRTLRFTNIPGHGRHASSAEWLEIETKSHAIWTAFSDTQRKRFITSQVPNWFSYLLSGLLLSAITAVFSAFLIKTHYFASVPGNLLIPFMVFVVALGAIGAAASISMNALSLQDDATFDISNGRFLWLRLLLGALFGAILTISWIFPVFQFFITALMNDPESSIKITSEQLTQALWLITPFVLGFSTSLVILILSRAVDSIQTFFGKQQK